MVDSASIETFSESEMLIRMGMSRARLRAAMKITSNIHNQLCFIIFASIEKRQSLRTVV